MSICRPKPTAPRPKPRPRIDRALTGHDVLAAALGHAYAAGRAIQLIGEHRQTIRRSAHRRHVRRIDRALTVIDRTQHALLGIVALLACAPAAWTYM